jgi:hypothetical protein
VIAPVTTRLDTAVNTDGEVTVRIILCDSYGNDKIILSTGRDKDTHAAKTNALKDAYVALELMRSQIDKVVG